MIRREKSNEDKEDYQRHFLRTLTVLLLITGWQVLQSPAARGSQWETVVSDRIEDERPHHKTIPGDSLGDADTPENAGSVSFVDNKVVAPGCWILYQGKFSQTPISIPPSTNAIVAIIRDKKVFLYHPAVGSAPLSRRTSAISFIYFIQERFGPAPSAAAIAMRPASSEKKEKPIKILQTLGGTSYLDSGFNIKLERWNQHNTKQAVLLASNNARRWGAVKTDVLNPRNRRHLCFFVPRSNFLPTNILDVMGRSWSAVQDRQAIALIKSTQAENIHAEKSIETFGAFWRAYWLNPKGPPPIDNTVYHNNKKLYQDLNDIDKKMAILSLLQNILGQIPLECVDILTNFSATLIGSHIITRMGEGSRDVAWNKATLAFQISGLKDIVSSLGICCVKKGGLVSGPVGIINWLVQEVVQSAWDAINFAVFSVEERWVAPYQMASYLAYEKLMVEKEYAVYRWFPTEGDLSRYARQFKTYLPAQFKEMPAAQSLFGNDLKLKSTCEIDAGRWWVESRLFSDDTERKTMEDWKKRIEKYKKNSMPEDIKNPKTTVVLKEKKLFIQRNSTEGRSHVILEFIYKNAIVIISDSLPPGAGSIAEKLATCSRKIIDEKIKGK